MGAEAEIYSSCCAAERIVDDVYRLQSHVGCGPSTTVWQACKVDDAESRFILKFYDTGAEKALAFLELLEREFDSFVVKNPNVLSPIALGIHETLTYSVSPYTGCRSLRSIATAHSARFTGNETRVLSLFLRMMKGVVWLHKMNYSHLDLLPENLLLAQGDRVMLTDFGLNRILRNVTGLVAGPNNIVHPAYASPERFVGMSGSPADDVFSIGVMLYELACGVQPWNGKGGLAIIQGADMPELKGGCFSRHFSDLLADCLSGDPADRPESPDIQQRIHWILQHPQMLPQASTANTNGVGMPAPAAPRDGTALHAASHSKDPGAALEPGLDGGPLPDRPHAEALIAKQQREIEELRRQLATEKGRVKEAALQVRAELRAQLEELRRQLATEAAAKIEEARKRNEQEALARIEAERNNSSRQAEEHIAQARQETVKEIQRRVSHELETQRIAEVARREHEEAERRAAVHAERERWNETALATQRKLEQSAYTIRELKDILKTEIRARQLAESKLRAAQDVRTAVDRERMDRDREELEERKQLEGELRQELGKMFVGGLQQVARDSSPTHDARLGDAHREMVGDRSIPAQAMDAAAKNPPVAAISEEAEMDPANGTALHGPELIEWLKGRLRNTLEKDIVHLVRDVMARDYHSSDNGVAATGTPMEAEAEQPLPVVTADAEKDAWRDDAVIEHWESAESEDGKPETVLAQMLSEVERRLQTDRLFPPTTTAKSSAWRHIPSH